MTSKRRFVKAGVALAACALLSSCASLSGPRQVEIPLRKLQAGLERRFPLSHPLMGLFDIRLSRPQLALQPEADRVALSVDGLDADVLTATRDLSDYYEKVAAASKDPKAVANWVMGDLAGILKAESKEIG